jgi:hypothetical protein
MSKVDLKKEFKPLYTAFDHAVDLINVPALNYLRIDGNGDPATSAAFDAAVEALYALAYGIKTQLKHSAAGRDYVVMPLEGLWWAEDATDYTSRPPASWQWTLMIVQPDEVSPRLVKAVSQEIAEKNPLPALQQVRFEPFHEGLAAQIMHIGPYTTIAATIARLHTFLARNDYAMHGTHHEIYLSDRRRTAPEKLKTIIRQPVTRVAEQP